MRNAIDAESGAKTGKPRNPVRAAELRRLRRLAERRGCMHFKRRAEPNQRNARSGFQVLQSTEIEIEFLGLPLRSHFVVWLSAHCNYRSARPLAKENANRRAANRFRSVSFLAMSLKYFGVSIVFVLLLSPRSALDNPFRVPRSRNFSASRGFSTVLALGWPPQSVHRPAVGRNAPD